MSASVEHGAPAEHFFTAAADNVGEATSAASSSSSSGKASFVSQPQAEASGEGDGGNDEEEKLEEVSSVEVRMEEMRRMKDELLSQLEPDKDLAKAQEAKEAGNDYFRDKDYDGAVTEYSRAISLCPSDQTETLAVFYGNRAAAYMADNELSLTIEDCTAALELKNDYVKVLMRRSVCYEKTDNIEGAFQDAKKTLELDPSWPKIRETVARLELQYNAKMERLKEDALGKLKDLGNSILGNFGMSLDNFKMEQDPTTGSWSIGMKPK